MNVIIAGVVPNSIVDGPGLRYTLFVQGCPHKCKGCHNQHTWDFAGGKMMDIDQIFTQIKYDVLLSGITFSGGEPFCQARPLVELARKVHSIGLSVVTYTGFKIEELIRMAKTNDPIKDLLLETDILIDGPFIEEEKSLELKFRGSKNQRIIDCQKTWQQGKIILMEDI